ncbi:MAG: IS21 family transposase [Chloroflexi bacterium]|nr:IS21 family transposase [Chloroflexota bacterium]
MTQERLSLRKIREVLRLKYEIGLSNRAIARACQVSNSTVGEYIARAEQAGLKWPLPENCSEEDLYQKLFPEGETPVLSERPVPNWEEIHRELSRRGVTLMLLWQEYRERHPDGYGRTQFFEHYQRWNQSHTTSMRLPHKGGEVLEVDYAGMTISITDSETGEITQAQVFVAVLPASSYTYAEIQPSQELNHWLAGHVRAFAFFGGTPKILRPDNLKSGVKKPNYYEPDLNPSYQELAEHYHMAVLPARVKKPKDKSHAENGVQNVERWILAPLRNHVFFSIAEANHAIAPLLEALNQKEMQHLGKSRRQLFEEVDQSALLPLPEHSYEFARWKNARVNIDYHVAFEGHYYSVPHALVGQEVRIRATEHILEIFQRDKQVAIHPLNSVQGRFSTCPDHMPAHHRFVLNTDSDWLLREAAKVGPQTAAYMTALLHSRPYPQQAFRTCLGVLDLARKHSQTHLELACQHLLPTHLFSYQDLKSELEHLSKDVSTDPLPAHENVRGDSYYH